MRHRDFTAFILPSALAMLLFIALPIVEKLYNATAGKRDLANAQKKEA